MKTGCEQARTWTSLDLDGALSAFERRLLARHLGRCQPCRTFATDSAELTRMLREAPLEPAFVAVPLPRRRVVQPAWGMVGVAAAAAAVMFAFSSPFGNSARNSVAPTAGGRASALALVDTAADTLGVRHDARLVQAPATHVGNVRGEFGIPA